MRTGDVVRHVVPTEHGLDPHVLSWTDDRTVAVASDHLTTAAVESYSGRTVVRLFSLGHADPVVLPHSNVLPVPVVTTAAYAGMVRPRLLRSYGSLGRVTEEVRMSTSLVNAAYDAASGRLAGIRGDPTQGGSGPGRLMVGRASDGRAQLSAVPGGHRYYPCSAGRMPTTSSPTRGGAPACPPGRRRTDRGRAAPDLDRVPDPGSHRYGVTLASGALHHP